MAVLEEVKAGDKKNSRKAVDAKVLALFADTPRLLVDFRIFATPCCMTKLVQWSKRRWEVPRGTKFPVAFYDKRGNLLVAKSQTELRKSLAHLLGVRQVLLFEVPVGARFVWVEFCRGQKPALLKPNTNRPVPLDQHAIERVEKTWRLLFPEVSKFRLGFYVTVDGKFKVMEGSIVGYR